MGRVLETLITKALERVPSFRDFMFVSELYESSRRLVKDHGDVAELVEAGESRAGLPVEALVLKGGSRSTVLAYAFPHPNEPVGSLTLEALSWMLVRDRELLRTLGATWVMVKVADVEGALLNEGWFKGPFTLEKYLTNYYRPPPYKQVEWTFPIEYKTLRWDRPTLETKALMRLIDQWRPTHLYSLHNAYFTGTFYYVSGSPDWETLRWLSEIPKRLKVPLHRGVPERPYIKRLGDGVYSMYSIVDEYDWLEVHSEVDPAEVLKVGDNGYGYARRVNPRVFAMICEVPYIYDDRLDNETRIGIPLREIYRLSLEKSRRNMDEMVRFADTVDQHISHDNPYYEGVRYHLKFIEKEIRAEMGWVEREPSLDKPATVAQALHTYMITIWERMTFYGRTYRALVYEEKGGKAVPSKLKREARERLRQSIDVFERLVEYRVIPVNDLVKIQLAAIIATVAQWAR